MNTILICDDDRDIVNAVGIYLKGEGYNVLKAYNGKEAVDMIKTNKDISLVVLDIMMPVMDGLTACNEIREISNIPIILLTAKSQDADKIIGLNIGADDYITKPFNPVELIARVRSQLRRFITLGGGLNPKTEKVVGNIVMDDLAKKVMVEGEEIMLTPTEYGILKVLMDRPGKVCSPKEIYKEVWSGDPYGAEGTIAVHIRHLREKIEVDPANPRYIKVMWGQGYKLDE
ncbi:MAG: response regulator transcription factor [Lachnospiraceae bacterium]|nr:response regulator transcription factor [Lachnospiraceae bacterium]